MPAIITQISQLSQKNRAIYRLWPLTVLLAATWALFLLPLADHGLREDEALYASWAITMRHGNPWLSGLPIDKPPLYLWLLAGWQSWAGETAPAMRLLNTSVTLVSVALVYALGCRLAGRRTGLLAAIVFAASPFTILFAPTLYTDPLLVLWFLAASLAATYGRWSGLGLCLGLALITKQHALLLAPLPLALAVPQLTALARRDRVLAGLRVALGLALPLGVVWAWDAARLSQSPTGGPVNVWQQSAINYGGLTLVAPEHWTARASAWLEQAQYMTGYLPATFVALVAAVVLAARLPRGPSRRASRPEAMPGRGLRPLIVFALAYLALHTVVGFQVWDRYLLPLVPLMALVAGWGWAQLTRRLGIAALLLLVCCLLPPTLQAAAGAYPIGGDHGAYDGIDATAVTIREVLPDNKWGVLYHHTLGWHWRYYLAGAHFQQVYYATPDDLATDAAGPGGYVRLLVVPATEDVAPVRQALASHGLQLRQRATTYRKDGTPTFYVWAVESVAPAWPASRPMTPHGPQEVP